MLRRIVLNGAGFEHIESLSYILFCLNRWSAETHFNQTEAGMQVLIPDIRFSFILLIEHLLLIFSVLTYFNLHRIVSYRVLPALGNYCIHCI